VADKNCEKIHYIADNMYCCGAGTAADTEFTTGAPTVSALRAPSHTRLLPLTHPPRPEQISHQIRLHSLATERQARVITALTMLKRHLFRYQGHVSAALVLGGVDATGPSIYTVYPHGSTDRLPYATMGSGSLAAMAVFESGYKEDMEEEEAKELVRQAIQAGIFNDLGSGSNVDLCVITKDGARKYRNDVKPNERLFRETYSFPRGATRAWVGVGWGGVV